MYECTKKEVKRCDFTERMKAMREDNDLKQKEIADVLKITQQQYSLYESGKRKIPVEAIIELCKFYDVSADYMLGFTKEPKRLPRK